jgi:hypothetical protein
MKEEGSMGRRMGRGGTRPYLIEVSWQRVEKCFTLPSGRCTDERIEDDVFLRWGGAVGYHPKMGGYPDLYNHLLDLMRRALPFLVSLPLAFVASGCVYALHVSSQPTDVKLRVQASQPQQFVVRVAVEQPADYLVSSDGRVEFTVPRFSNGCDVYLFGVIKTRDGSAESVRVVELRHAERALRRLSLSQIAKLPTDAAGYSIVKIGD